MASKALKETSDSLVGKLFMSRDKIIKISTDNGATVSGYDVVNETFCIIPKNYLMAIPPAVIALLSSERAKLLVARANCKTVRAMAKMLHLSERTVYRQLRIHLDQEDES
jgi:DNA-binding NarL/FixJ family response regulator